jgi:cytochrome c2
MSRRIWLPRAPGLAAIAAAGLVGCAETDTSRVVVAGGDAERGRIEIARLQCGACHAIPGVRAARGSVGPPLEGFARRVYLAGKWPNRPNYLEPWLRDPPAMAPLTAMPALVDDPQSARDIAAYLYTLE